MKRALFLAVCAIFAASISYAEATVNKPLNGKNLDGWKAVHENDTNSWKIAKDVKISDENPRTLELVGDAEGENAVLVNLVGGDWKPRGVDLRTEAEFGDCTIELEFFLSKGSNSGVYLMGIYELQVNDSFGKPEDKLGQGDVGAIYSAAAPKTNAALEHGQWQKYVIDFVAPKFDADGNKIKNAFVKKAVLNGKIVQENIEIKGPTGGGYTDKESAKGPLMLQGNHGPIAFKNIKITEIP